MAGINTWRQFVSQLEQLRKPYEDELKEIELGTWMTRCDPDGRPEEDPRALASELECIVDHLTNLIQEIKDAHFGEHA